MSSQTQTLEPNHFFSFLDTQAKRTPGGRGIRTELGRHCAQWPQSAPDSGEVMARTRRTARVRVLCAWVSQYIVGWVIFFVCVCEGGREGGREGWRDGVRKSMCVYACAFICE